MPIYGINWLYYIVWEVYSLHETINHLDYLPLLSLTIKVALQVTVALLCSYIMIKSLTVNHKQLISIENKLFFENAIVMFNFDIDAHLSCLQVFLIWRWICIDQLRLKIMSAEEIDKADTKMWKIPFWIGVTLISCIVNVFFLEKLIR